GAQSRALEGRRPMRCHVRLCVAWADHPSRLASLAPQDDVVQQPRPCPNQHRLSRHIPGPPLMLRALLFRRPPEPQAIEVAFDRAIYSVRVRRHPQARRYTLRIQAATREVVLTIPPRGSLKEARAFAERHGGWIAARLRRLPAAVAFAHGTVVPVRGLEHRIEHLRGARGTVWREAGPDGTPLLCVAGEAPHVGRRVRDHLKREAKRDL